MGKNWAYGLMRWRPHVDHRGACVLNHLHPFRFDMLLPARAPHGALSVTVEVGFSLHTFTCMRRPLDDAASLYADDRERRTFDEVRYRLSFQLPALIRALPSRQCGFAHHGNFVLIDGVTHDGRPVTYAIFFAVRREAAANTVRLVVQSAYPLDPGKPLPSRGRVNFATIIGATLHGKTLRVP